MKKNDVIREILTDKPVRLQPQGQAFAPINIALIKYWGKRDQELNLPVTSSLSLSLPPLGSTTKISLSQTCDDTVILNGREITKDQEFYHRISAYLNLFRTTDAPAFHIETANNIPTAGGLASSASGYAALILALNDLFSWQLPDRDLSILARLGSGSACRSLHHGFVEWQAGSLASGMDSHALPLSYRWPELRLGIIKVSDKEKSLSSRAAMQQTVVSSPLYSAWPETVTRDLGALRQAIAMQDFHRFGEISEQNALTMHATMLAAWPPICYWQPGTLDILQRLWKLRGTGLPVYVTLDAGANPVLIFLESEITAIIAGFPEIKIIKPEFGA